MYFESVCSVRRVRRQMLSWVGLPMVVGWSEDRDEVAETRGLKGGSAEHSGPDETRVRVRAEARAKAGDVDNLHAAYRSG